MANIRVDLNGALTDGMTVTFKAPCDCTNITGLKIYHVKDGVMVGEEFTMKDAMVNNLSNTNNLFGAGAYVTVVLDTYNHRAFLQNASSSEYLEQKVMPVDHFESESGELAASARTVHVLNQNMGGCVFSAESDGAYVTYLQGGTTVKKKLGESELKTATIPTGTYQTKKITTDGKPHIIMCALCTSSSNVWNVFSMYSDGYCGPVFNINRDSAVGGTGTQIKNVNNTGFTIDLGNSLNVTAAVCYYIS